MQQQIAPDGRWVSRLRIAGWSTVALLLAAPLVAMQFSGDVDWSVADFVLMGVLLALVGGAIELAVRARNLFYAVGVAVAAGTAFLLIIGCLAMGFVGDGGPADLVFLGVLAVGFAGVAIARFRASGMAWALFAAAAAQVAAGAVGLALAPRADVAEVVRMTAIFAALFAASGALFRRAARTGA